MLDTPAGGASVALTSTIPVPAGGIGTGDGAGVGVGIGAGAGDGVGAGVGAGAGAGDGTDIQPPTSTPIKLTTSINDRISNVSRLPCIPSPGLRVVFSQNTFRTSNYFNIKC